MPERKIGRWPTAAAEQGSPIRGRKLARLNEHTLIPDIVNLEFHRGVHGRGLRRRPGVRIVEVFKGRDGCEYIQFSEDYENDDKWANHPLFGDDDADLAKYAMDVLARYDLPRPRTPLYFWEDERARLCWGADPPPHIEPDQNRFTGFTEEIAQKFIEENIDKDPACIEAVYASQFLDLFNTIESDLAGVLHLLWKEHAHPSGQTLKQFVGEDPDELAQAVLDLGLETGRELGAIRAEWRLSLLHDPIVERAERDARVRRSGGKRTATRRAAEADQKWRVAGLAFARRRRAQNPKIGQKSLAHEIAGRVEGAPSLDQIAATIRGWEHSGELIRSILNPVQNGKAR